MLEVFQLKHFDTVRSNLYNHVSLMRISLNYNLPLKESIHEPCMKTKPFAAFLFASWLVANTANAGEIIGRVNFPSGTDGRRSPAVVFLTSSNVTPSSSQQAVVVDQRDREFVPHVQAMTLGDSVIFRNSDGEAHNVNSQSGCCSFNFMISPADASGPGTSGPFKPEKPDVLRLLCNIHSQMRGFVVVCPNSMHALTDAQGGFRIEGVPDGPYKLVVWHESCPQLSRQIEVASETRLNVDLQAAESGQGTPTAMVARPVLPWREVLRQIASKLDAAVAAAESGSSSEADQLALDAYFECFEASELETAVLLFRGEERKFLLERMFATIRRPLLVDLASGKAEASRVRSAIAELTQAIESDIAELDAKGVADRTALGSSAPGASPSVASGVGPTDVARAMDELRLNFAEIVKLVERGESTAAATALADCYFQVFHRIEPALAAHDYAQVRQIENRFLELRGSIRAGLAANDASAGLDGLRVQIDRAASAIVQADRTGIASAANRFWNAFVILTREGVEALLIVTALLLYLERSKRPEAKRLIYGGIALAAVATLITWSGLQWMIAQSGVARETIEGVAALAAGTVLFYVSYWLISKSEAHRWQQFLTRQVDRHLTSGSRWAIGLAAFLAVYREGAETIT